MTRKPPLCNQPLMCHATRVTTLWLKQPIYFQCIAVYTWLARERRQTMSIHKEKLSFLCFLRSSISDRFNFSAISSLHECTQQSLISTIFSLHHSKLHTIHVTIVKKSYQKIMGAVTCGVPIFCMGVYKHNVVVVKWYLHSQGDYFSWVLMISISGYLSIITM